MNHFGELSIVHLVGRPPNRYPSRRWLLVQPVARSEVCFTMALIYEVDVNTAIIGNPLFLVKARMQVIIPLYQPALYVMTDISQGIFSRSSYRDTTLLQELPRCSYNNLADRGYSRLRSGNGRCYSSYSNGLICSTTNV